MKDNAAEKEKSDLLQEIQIMQQVGATHPNIVTLLGVCTEKGNEIVDLGQQTCFAFCWIHSLC